MPTKLTVPVAVLFTSSMAFAGGTNHYIPSSATPTVALSHQLSSAKQPIAITPSATAASSHMAQVAAAHAVAQGQSHLQAQGQPLTIQHNGSFSTSSWVKHGWFAGIGVGTSLIGHQFTRHTPDGHGDIINPMGDVGTAGDIYGGYGVSKGMLSLVGQLGFTYNTAKAHVNDPTTANGNLVDTYQSIDNKYLVHLDIQPGVLFQNSRLYTDIGMSLGRYAARSTSNINATPNYTSTQLGWIVGAGMQTRASSHIDLRINYADVNGSRFSYTNSGNTYSYRPSAEVFTAGAVYNFAATADQATAKLADGPYMGFMFGRDAAEANIVASGLTNGSYNSEDALTGVGGRVYAGIARNFNRFVGAVEGYYGLSNAEVKRSGSEYPYVFDMNDSYGVSLLPGLRLDSASKLYARLGAVWTNFEKTRGSQPVMNDKTAFGFQAGLGLETALNNTLSLRAEYDFTHYNKLRFDNSTNSSTSDESLTTRLNQFMVGLTYHFVG